MCADCGWQDYLGKIEDLQDDKSSEFLDSVHEWVSDNEHVTEDQARTVDRIADERGL
ncbi:MAG TPA: hypothetical protein VJZ50_11735 [Candidatus Limnocylindrales bacterium]|nr:hypothetical protein [Candidatus Limnocylindrales bacterium]